MVTVACWFDGSQAGRESMLKSSSWGLRWLRQKPATTAWFGIRSVRRARYLRRVSRRAGRNAHLTGRGRGRAGEKASELFAKPADD